MPIASQFLANATGTVLASGTDFLEVGCGAVDWSATEANVNIPWRAAGTFSGLYANMQTRASTSILTVTFRNAGAAGNQTISIGTAATGIFQDTIDSDVVVAGSKVDVEFVIPSGSITLEAMNVAFNVGTGSTVTRLLNCGPANIALSSSTSYYLPVGANVAIALETNAQFKSATAGTLNNLLTIITANARPNATTFNSRVNAAAGSLTISVGSASTGIFEDTSHSDVYASGSLFNYQTISGSGSATLTIEVFGAQFVSGGTNMSVPFITGGSAVGVSSGAATFYLAAAGSAGHNTADADAANYALTTYTASHMQAFVSANSLTATTALAFMLGTVSGAQAISIGSASTGFFADTTDVDIVTSITKLISYRVEVGATGTSITINTIGHWMSFPASVVAAIQHFLASLGCGG